MKMASACIVTGQMAVDAVFEMLNITKAERDKFFNDRAKELEGETGKAPANRRPRPWTRILSHHQTHRARPFRFELRRLRQHVARGRLSFRSHRGGSIGGDNTADNCAVLCKTCHKLKTGKQDIPRIAKTKQVSRKRMAFASRHVCREAEIRRGRRRFQER